MVGWVVSSNVQSCLPKLCLDGHRRKIGKRSCHIFYVALQNENKKMIENTKLLKEIGGSRAGLVKNAKEVTTGKGGHLTTL